MTTASEVLKSVAPFERLDPSELARLDADGRVVRVAEGEIVWEKGAELGGAYILLEGSLFERRPDGVVVHQEPGAIAGAGAWLSGGPSEYAAKAASDVVLLELSREVFESHIEGQSQLSRVLLEGVTKELVGRVRELNQKLNDLVGQTEPE